MKILFLVFFILLGSSAWALEPSQDPRIIGLLDARHYDGTKNGKLKLSPGNGNNWYIDGTKGDDAYDGRFPDRVPGTNHGPKKTLKAMFKQYTDPGKGAHVLIKAGTYYESWPWFYGPPYWSANDENNRMMIGPYGDGEVIVTQQLDLRGKTWEKHSPNIFRIQTDITGKGGTYSAGIHHVVIDNDFRSFHMVTSTRNPGMSGLKKYGDWWWDNQSGYLYVYTGGFNPGERNTIVLNNSGPEDEAWSLYFSYNPSYITFYGLTFVGSHASLWIASGQHINFDNCRFMYANRAGLSLTGEAKNCRVTKNLFYANVMNNWPRGHRSDNQVDGLWQAVLSPSPTTYIAGNIIMDGGGEGIQGVNDAIIEDNIVVDNFSVGIYAGVGANQIIRRNIVLATRQDFNDLFGWPEHLGTFWEKIRRKIRQTGITIAAEDIRGDFHNTKIYNNLIIGARYGISSAEGRGNFGIKDTDIFNNLIITPNFDGALVADNFTGILMNNWSTKSYNSNIRNNIIIAQYPVNTFLAQRGPIANGPDTGIKWDYNIYFFPTNLKSPFHEYYGRGSYNFNAWKATFNIDEHSRYVDPRLNRINWADVSQLKIGDFQLQDNSLAKDRGKDLSSEFATDYNLGKRPQGINWDIGAFEAGAAANVPSCLWDSDTCSFDSDCCGGHCCQSICASQACPQLIVDSKSGSKVPHPIADALVKNVALGKTATASSVYRNLAVKQAVDGRSTTRWQAEEPDPQWIAVDLGATYHITRVVLNWVDLASAKSYKIQVSMDAEKWADIFTKTNGSGGVEDLSALSGSGRYVRVYATERNDKWGISLYEFEIYGTLEGLAPAVQSAVR